MSKNYFYYTYIITNYKTFVKVHLLNSTIKVYDFIHIGIILLCIFKEHRAPFIICASFTTLILQHLFLNLSSHNLIFLCEHLRAVHLCYKYIITYFTAFVNTLFLFCRGGIISLLYSIAIYFYFVNPLFQVLQNTFLLFYIYIIAYSFIFVKVLFIFFRTLAKFFSAILIL